MQEDWHLDYMLIGLLLVILAIVAYGAYMAGYIPGLSPEGS